jgi:hypothetical protein
MKEQYMSRRYAPDHKKLVLKILDNFKGNVITTSRYTGIPERTLREWRMEQRLARIRQRAAMKKTKMPSQQ